MQEREALTNVVVISGDREIACALSQEGAIIYPAYSCYYDGFVNDVMTEYANPSIYRPPSVRRARLQSQVSLRFEREADDLAFAHPMEGQERLFHSSIKSRLFERPGTYYVGWTMYDQNGAEENLTVWLGPRQVAYVRSDDNDNRVHLYLLEQPFYIDSGERLRLITDPTDGPYRLENIVLLPTLPRATSRELHISDIALEVEETRGQPVLQLNWRTSRPTRCQVAWDNGTSAGQVADDQLLENHSLTLPSLKPTDQARFRINAIDEANRAASTEWLDLAAYLPIAGEAQPGRLSFTLDNQVGQPTSAWPVTWGFPFPRSALWDLQQCRLVTMDGQPMPAQRRVQVRWDDGSIRWALFDFQADLPASGRLDLALEWGPQVRDEPPAGLVAKACAEGIRIDAGLLRLAIDKADYAFPARVEVRQGQRFVPALGYGEVPTAIALIDGTGKAYGAEVEDVSLEESGPLRAVVKVGLRHRAGDGAYLWRSVLRLSAYYGKPFLRVQHTFENDNLESLFTSVRSLTLNASVASGWLGQVQTGEERAALSGGLVSLFQPFDDSFSLSQGGATLRAGEHAPNWLASSGQQGTLAVAMRDFWQNYPKAWQVNEQGISIGICPDVSGVAYPSGGIEEVRSFYYLQGGQYRLKRGMARTHDMLFAFATNSAEALGDIRQFSEPPFVRVSPGLFEQTGVLSPLSGRGDKGTERYDRWTDEALAVFEADRTQSRAYGMLNFGDWYGERRYNWGDMEYDTPYGFILEYLRGGSSRYFTLGYQAAWHLADVDTCHYHPDPNMAGRQYLHSLGHVGDYYQNDYLPGAIAGEAISWTHTWVEGLFLYALLTGERRLWEAANRTVEILSRAELNYFDFTNCRDAGWPLRHLIGAYQTTGRKFYLNGASIIVERVLERQRSTGGWERLMVPGHCHHIPPRHMGNAGFMVGVLLAALKRYHEETREQAVGDSIVAASHYLVRSMWATDQSAFHYTSCPQSRIALELNTQILEGIAYGWRLSRDEELRQVLTSGIASCFTPPHNSPEPPDGKDISMRLRSMPFIMRDVVAAMAERA